MVISNMLMYFVFFSVGRMRRLKVLFILLAVSCACFAVVMLYPPSLSLLATKNVMIVQKQFTRTVTQAQVSV